MLDEDGDEVGQTEVYNKTVKRKKVVESYFDAASITDILIIICFKEAWRWKQPGESTSRVVATVLGIVETDAYLFYKKFHFL